MVPGVVMGLVLAAASFAIPALDTPSTPRNVPKVSPAAGDMAVVEMTQAEGEALLAQLTVAREGPRAGYVREKFRHWIDADRDGCKTRAEILIEESRVPAVTGPKCTVVSGDWFSFYDERVIASPGGIDIDHMVPLAEAWDSGASGWDAKRRERYANDLDHPEALIAVSSGSNRSKSEQDPAEWKPPSREGWCRYAREWVTVKIAWKLTADEAEMEGLRTLMGTCGGG